MATTTTTANRRLGMEVEPMEPIEQARKAANDVLEKAKGAVECGVAAAGHTVSAAAKRADDFAAAGGQQVKALGDTIEQNAPHSGIAGQAAHAVASGLRGSGEYLERAKLSGMAQDVAELVKKHPVPSIFICLAVGYCVARMFRE